MRNNDAIDNNIFTYFNVLNSRDNFRRSAGPHSDEFNTYDTIGLKYFKIFFYFNNGDSDSIGANLSSSTGLLAPTWELSGVSDDNYYQYNSAWSYLKMNCEDERADLLKNFVNLLSNISTKSPWYFSEISGLDAALERKQTMEQNFAMEAERKKISIKCLPDAYDNRIGTLLDLYRAIVWSWKTKRVILPANLRKFDMGIFIFNDPIANLAVSNSGSEFSLETNLSATPGHMYNKLAQVQKTRDLLSSKSIENRYEPQYAYSQISDKSQYYQSSYKYIEFHNCEIDYNSGKTPWGTLTNVDGVSPQYTIDILFDDCYEYGYNEFNMKSFGDMIMWDMDWRNRYNEENNSYLFEILANRYNGDAGIGVRYEWMPNKSTHSLLDNLPDDSIIDTVESLVGKKISEKAQEIVEEGKDTVRRKISEKVQEITDDGKITARRKMSETVAEASENAVMGSFKNSAAVRTLPDINPLKNAVDQLIGTSKNIVWGVLKKAAMGNLYTFSLTRLIDQGKSLLDGNIWTAARNVAEYIQDAKQREESGLPAGHSLFSDPTYTMQTVDDIGNLFEPKKITPTVKRIGNMNQAKSIGNNI